MLNYNKLDIEKYQHYNPTDHFQPGQDYDMFMYNYLRSMDDKVYVSKLINHDIKSLCMENIGEDMNRRLAGDIKDEFDITDPYTMRCVEEELAIHLSRIHQRRVGKVSLLDQTDNSKQLWINFQRPTEFNPKHRHSGVFSFVIYVSIPEEIRQEYTAAKSNPSGKRRGMIEFTSKRANEALIFNPRTDDILVFSSDHDHQVYPFYSDNVRVTVSGNINLMEWAE